MNDIKTEDKITEARLKNTQGQPWSLTNDEINQIVEALEFKKNHEYFLLKDKKYQKVTQEEFAGQDGLGNNCTTVRNVYLNELKEKADESVMYNERCDKYEVKSIMLEQEINSLTVEGNE